MNKRCSFLISLLFCLTGFSQTTKTVAFADTALKAGKHRVAIITYEFPEQIKNLQRKAIVNLKANPAWKDKYIVRQVELGTKTLDYLDAFGLSKTEFMIMLNGFKNEKHAVTKDSAVLKIERSNGVISFKSDSTISEFNYLTINTWKKEIIYDNFKLTREVELTGQKFYAPILFGFESFWAVNIPEKKSKTNSGASFSIGINSGDTRTTLCLLLNSSISQSKTLVITIL